MKNISWFYLTYDLDYSTESEKRLITVRNGIKKQKTKAKYYQRSIKDTLKTAIK